MYRPYDWSLAGARGVATATRDAAALDDSGMVAGGHRVETEHHGPSRNRSNLRCDCSRRTGWGSGPARGRPRTVDDVTVEIVGEVEDVVVHAELRRDPPGVLHIRHRAATRSEGPPHSFIVAPTTSWPASTIIAAATDESTPPHIATSTRTYRRSAAARSLAKLLAKLAAGARPATPG